LNDPGAQASAYWPLLVYAILVFILAVVILGVSYVLGERHKERETGDPFESGVAATGPARFRFSIQFYLLAMFFVVFDLESAFIFAWAIAFRDLGWGGYVAILVFVLTFLLMIFYLARAGALDFVGKRPTTTARRQAQNAPERSR
jgi:NADH-quinone oxidoreductase subunit A